MTPHLTPEGSTAIPIVTPDDFFTSDTPPRLSYLAMTSPRFSFMSTPANAHRSKDRAAAVLLRFSYEAREELKRRAHEQGMSVQQYADWKLLDFDPSQPIGGRAVGQRPLEGLSA